MTYLWLLKYSSITFFASTAKHFLFGKDTYVFSLYSHISCSLFNHTVSLIWHLDSFINVQSWDSALLLSRQQCGGGKGRKKWRRGNLLVAITKGSKKHLRWKCVKCQIEELGHRTHFRKQIYRNLLLMDGVYLDLNVSAGEVPLMARLISNMLNVWG